MLLSCRREHDNNRGVRREGPKIHRGAPWRALLTPLEPARLQREKAAGPCFTIPVSPPLDLANPIAAARNSFGSLFHQGSGARRSVCDLSTNLPSGAHLACGCLHRPPEHPTATSQAYERRATGPPPLRRSGRGPTEGESCEKRMNPPPRQIVVEVAPDHDPAGAGRPRTAERNAAIRGNRPTPRRCLAVARTRGISRGRPGVTISDAFAC